jgi:hypothetical protein
MRGIGISKRRLALIAAFWAAAAQAPAQSPPPGFKFSYQSAGVSAVAIANGDTIQFPVTPVGSSSAVTLVIASTYPSTWTVTRATATGPGFAALGAGIPVPANGASSFLITSTPSAVGAFNGGLSVTLSNAAGESVNVSFTLSATGLSGVLMSYTLNSGNQTLLSDRGVIPFPLTPVNTASNALFAVSNRTSAPITLNSALISGTAFRTVGLPLLPLQIAVGQEVRFTISFTPTDSSVTSGALLLTIGGSTSTIELTGRGSGPVLSYESGDGSSFTPLSPGAAISFGSADVNTGQSRVTVRVQNSGNLAAQLAGISSSRVDFQLPDLPRFPATIAAGESLSFSILFAPRIAGQVNGTLSIGGAVFQMTGTALGSSFSVTLVTATQRTPIAVGNSANLAPTAIGNRQPFLLEIANVGNQEGTITSLRLLGGGFAITKAPSLPVTLLAGEAIQVEAVFAPTVTGIVNGSVFVQEQGYGLIVTATAPPPAPSLTFTNVSPTMAPLLQPALGLTLAGPYPHDLEGILTISFASKGLGDDPNIQFVAGARFVPFKIPANSTAAVFGGGAQAAPFQTGSIAGVITLSVTLSVGSYNLTADAPREYAIAIPAAAPVIYSVELLGQSATAVNLLIKGYSTSRSVQQVSLELAPNVGAILQTTSLRANVESAFNTWFKSSGGQSFGSQFALTLQLNVTGSVSAIKSVTVTATNDEGSSTPSSLALN